MEVGRMVLSVPHGCRQAQVLRACLPAPAWRALDVLSLLWHSGTS